MKILDIRKDEEFKNIIITFRTVIHLLEDNKYQVETNILGVNAGEEWFNPTPLVITSLKECGVSELGLEETISMQYSYLRDEALEASEKLTVTKNNVMQIFQSATRIKKYPS